MMIVQLILPFFAALLNIIIYDQLVCFYIGFLTSVLNILIFLLPKYTTYGLYNFGGWPETIGISHIYTISKSHITITIHCLMLAYYLLYAHNLITRAPIFHATLSLLYFGILGMLFTNDLFNLYVFLEVISLCNIIIISNYSNYKAALEYLIYGSFFATISLASIAIIMCNQKTLILSNIQNNFSFTSDITICSFLFGLLGKVGLYIFKLYKPNEDTYKTLNVRLMPILTFSGCIMLYKISECIHFVNYTQWITCLCLFNSIYAGYLAAKQKKIRDVFFFSIMSSNGYILLSILYIPELSISIIINEFITKFFLFFFLSYVKSDKISNLYTIKKYHLIYWGLLFTVFSSAGLPITNGFFIKISILQAIISQNHYITFIIILLTMGISINYHWRILYHIYLQKHETRHSLQLWKNMIILVYIFFVIFGNLIYLNIID